MPVQVVRSDIPLLVIGLGGTGKDIAFTIKKKFIERFSNQDPTTLLPERTAFIVFDGDRTDIGADPHGITGNEFCCLEFPALPNVFRQKSFTSEERPWVNENLSAESILDGAGGIRQVGRFQLFRRFPDVREKIHQALAKILGASPDSPPDHFSANILICGSLSGGTGSGTALDMAYIVRQLVRDEYPSYSTNMKLYGMFVMPQCILQRPGANGLSGSRRQDLQANAYAAMKEIDYWMRQDKHGDTMNVTFPGNYTVKWDGRPFSYLGYLGHTWENQQPINNSYEEAVKKVAELFLLLSTETPQSVDGKPAPHTIYSSLSNAGIEMMTHQDDAPYPVTAWAMSLGTSEYTSFEGDIDNYEVEKTLKQVLSVQLYDPKNGEVISEEDARVNGITPVVGTLGLNEIQDTFFDNLKLETNSEDDYIRQHSFPINDSMFDKAGIEASVDSLSYTVREYYQNLQSNAIAFYKDHYQTVWKNFQTEARKAITAISCGPIAFLRFLDEVYLPDVTNAFEEARQISKDGGEGQAQSDVLIAQADQSYDYLKILLHPGLNPKYLLDALNFDSFAQTYRTNIEELSASEWNWRCQLGRANALKDYQAKVKDYRDKLELIINTVRAQEQKLQNKTEDGADANALLSFTQLRSYLESMSLPDEGVAKARDRILNQIADLSFSLPRIDGANTFEQQDMLLRQFTAQMQSFVDNCFNDEELSNMDHVIDAAVSGTSEEPVNYMANKIAPRLAAAAKPMLGLLTEAKSMPTEFYEFHHIAVPKNAKNMLAGLSQYQNGTPGTESVQSDYSSSSITDRMLTLNLKVCIPMYMMPDVHVLMKAYQEQLSKIAAATSQGLHLVGQNQSNMLSDVTNTLDKSWRRLPDPIPPVEMMTISSLQKENQEYLEKRFREAVENGIIRFAGNGGVDPYEPGTAGKAYNQEVFEIHDFNLGDGVNSVHDRSLDEVCAAIDKVTNDTGVSARIRLQKLQSMRSGDPVQTIGYGRYMFNYANALHLNPIQPRPDDEKSTKDACANNYIATRDKLCGYMLGLYPRCLDLVEKEFRIFEYLHKAEQKMIDLIHDEEMLKEISQKYTMLFVMDLVGRKIDWFGLNHRGEFNRLFQNDMSIVPSEKLQRFPEYAFAKQFLNNEKDLQAEKEGVMNQINEDMQQYPADALTLSERGLKDEVMPKLAEKVELWGKTRQMITGDLSLKTAERKELLDVYDTLLGTATSILQALQLD